MPSFDTVSELNHHEISNAIDQTRREMGNRWDFKNVEASIEHEAKRITLIAEQDFQIDQMLEIMRMNFAKRKIDLRSLKEDGDSKSGKLVKRHFNIQEGIDQDTAKQIVRMIKDAKLKVQAAIQGDKVRVTGKKRDDLQEVMTFLRASEEIEIPLQFDNFRD